MGQTGTGGGVREGPASGRSVQCHGGQRCSGGLARAGGGRSRGRGWVWLLLSNCDAEVRRDRVPQGHTARLVLCRNVGFPGGSRGDGFVYKRTRQSWTDLTTGGSELGAVSHCPLLSPPGGPSREGTKPAFCLSLHLTRGPVACGLWPVAGPAECQGRCPVPYGDSHYWGTLLVGFPRWRETELQA